MGRKDNEPIPGKELQPALKITYMTDPLCCWSYGMQPHLDKLLSHFEGKISFKYVMGGMLPSWDQFYDEANAVSRPVQMGPVWMHAGQLTGRPVFHQLWIRNPPSSSYPACIAVKCVERQSPEAGITYFKKLQQAVMEAGRNIAEWEVLKEVAATLQTEHPSFEMAAFTADYAQQKGEAAFRSDLALVAQFRVTRFPTLLIEATGQPGILMPGYRTFEEIAAAITKAFHIEMPAPAIPQ